MTLTPIVLGGVVSGKTVAEGSIIGGLLMGIANLYIKPHMGLAAYDLLLLVIPGLAFVLQNCTHFLYQLCKLDPNAIQMRRGIKRVIKDIKKELKEDPRPERKEALLKDLEQQRDALRETLKPSSK